MCGIGKKYTKGGSYMSKKMCKRIFSVILSLGLVMVQSMNVNAAGNEIGKYSVFV